MPLNMIHWLGNHDNVKKRDKDYGSCVIDDCEESDDSSDQQKVLNYDTDCNCEQCNSNTNCKR